MFGFLKIINKLKESPDLLTLVISWSVAEICDVTPALTWEKNIRSNKNMYFLAQHAWRRPSCRMEISSKMDPECVWTKVRNYFHTSSIGTCLASEPVIEKTIRERRPGKKSNMVRWLVTQGQGQPVKSKPTRLSPPAPPSSSASISRLVAIPDVVHE